MSRLQVWSFKYSPGPSVSVPANTSPDEFFKFKLPQQLPKHVTEEDHDLVNPGLHMQSSIVLLPKADTVLAGQSVHEPVAFE